MFGNSVRIFIIMFSCGSWVFLYFKLFLYVRISYMIICVSMSINFVFLEFKLLALSVRMCCCCVLSLCQFFSNCHFFLRIYVVVLVTFFDIFLYIISVLFCKFAIFEFGFLYSILEPGNIYIYIYLSLASIWLCASKVVDFLFVLVLIIVRHSLRNYVLTSFIFW